MPEVMRSMTQNNGATQSPQSISNSDFTPGAQQVDLRGLCPNHTLVLVNGRRLADFPLPMDGGVSATDISSNPLGMLERIEVLTGSASAIYEIGRAYVSTPDTNPHLVSRLLTEKK